jgi:hypothetical protein
MEWGKTKLQAELGLNTKAWKQKIYLINIMRTFHL